MSFPRLILLHIEWANQANFKSGGYYNSIVCIIFKIRCLGNTTQTVYYAHRFSRIIFVFISFNRFVASLHCKPGLKKETSV